MSFDAQPTLIGHTVSLRPLAADDFEALYAAASDPLVWEQHPARNRHERDAFSAYFSDTLASGGALAVLDRSGTIIGTSRFQVWTPGPDAAVEIGWTFLRRDHWGDGTNREVKHLMLDHAFTGVERVLFRVAETNTRSRQAVQKLGARLLPDESAPMNGVPHVVYELRRSDWQASRA